MHGSQWILLAIVGFVMIVVGIGPARIPEWVWALSGGAIIVVVGFEPFDAALSAIAAQWNVLLFILGLMGLSAAAEESGAFAWVAEFILERARGSRRRLFVLLFMGGALVTFLLSNDATAIVFTPLVYRAVVKRGGDALPFLFGCVFVADTASFGLPFANPANILVLPRPHILDYVWHLGPPQLLAIAINLALFLVIFRPQLQGHYEFERCKAPNARVVRTLVATCCIVAAYLIALAFEWPLGPVALGGALMALTVARISPTSAIRHLSWSTFLLLAGLFALIDAVARAGFVDRAVRALAIASHFGSLPMISAASASSAVLSNVFNNLPVAVASSYVVAHASPQNVAYPLIVGIDLGPNLTTAGSLATILWLAILRERGIRVSALEYLRLGLIVVPPMIAVNVLWLWLIR